MQVMLEALIRWARGATGSLAERIEATLRTATRPVSLVGGLLQDLTRSPEELLAENAALRQQLIVVARTTKKPKFTPQRTVQKHMRRVSGPRPWGQTWSCDCLQFCDIWFQPIFAFFIIDLGARKVVHVGVTRNPTTTWVAQQLRNATPFGVGPRFLIRDNDDKFGVDFARAAKGAGVRVLRTAVRAPRMNAFCERFLGSVRRECLDHVVASTSTIGKPKASGTANPTRPIISRFT